MNTTQLERVVALAARAPSGDNTQPWTFVWDGQALKVVFDPGKAQHVLDAGLSGAKLSLGCVVESVAIAASEYGLATHCEYRDLSQANRGAAALITFTPNGAKSDPLLDAIENRNTDRRCFQNGPMPCAELREVWDGFEPKHNVALHFVDSVSPVLFDYVVAAESLVTIHPRIFLDTLPWIRLNDEEIERTCDGMPWRGTGINAFQYPFLQLLRKMPGAFRYVSRAGMGRAYAQRMKKLLRSSAGLICICARSNGGRVLENCGRLAMRVWLRLTQLGYGVHPLTLSSLLLYNAKIGVLDSESIRLFGKRYAEGEAILRKAFSISPDTLPVWMFRTGRSSPLPRHWFARRRSLANTLQIKS